MKLSHLYHPPTAVMVVLGLCVAFLVAPAQAQQAKALKISHQFPGGTIDEGDFRDRLVRKFAAEVEKRSNGQLEFEIYPASSLVKPVEQWGAMTSGSLDLSLYPLYAIQIIEARLFPFFARNHHGGT